MTVEKSFFELAKNFLQKIKKLQPQHKRNLKSKELFFWLSIETEQTKSHSRSK